MKNVFARLRQAVVQKRGIRNLTRIVAEMARDRVLSALHVEWLRVYGVQVGEGCRIRGRVRIVGDPRRVMIGDGCSLHAGVTFWTHDYGEGHGRIVLGKRVTCLRDVTFNSYERIEVGDDAAFGDGCYVQDNDHGTAPGTPVMQQPSHGSAIAIGNDVWFGARCIVLKGVSIGDHTIVGAGSVVVKALPADAVAVGVPCRVVKARGADSPRRVTVESRAA
jgi:acetyltransferase-like isoleucine patch superfamily enzyme